MNFVLFILGCIGLTNLIVNKSYFLPRKWLSSKLPASIYSVFNCYQCAGMWVGMILGAILIDWHLPMVFVCGCVSSFLSTLVSVFVEYLEANSVIDLRENGGND